MKQKILFTLISVIATISINTLTARGATSNSKGACYYINNKIEDYCIDGDNIYIVEKENNALLAISSITGNVSTIIPGVNGVYEGARKWIIEGVFVCNGKIFINISYRTANGTQYRTKIWDGKDINSSPNVDYDDNNALMLKVDEHNGSPYAIFGYKTYDYYSFLGAFLLNTEKMNFTWDINNNDVITVENFSKYVIDRKGNMWKFGVETKEHVNYNTGSYVVDSSLPGLFCLKRNGKEVFYRIDQLQYVHDEYENLFHLTNDEPKETISLRMVGDDLYFNVGRRIYKVNTSNTTTVDIVEYARIPANMPGIFSRDFQITSNGTIVDIDFVMRPGSFDKPDSPDKVIVKYKTPGRNYEEKVEWHLQYNNNRVYPDQHSNLIYFNTSSNNIIVYNPDGLNGYVAGKGKIIRVD